MRIFDPSPDELLFHYCSAQTLMSIVRTRAIRFSDINMMNDATEFQLGYKVFEEAATQLMTRKDLPAELPEIPKEFFDAVDEIISNIQLESHPFIACFSREQDSLEQWRAYGDDGRGFAIGFSAKKLKQLPVTMLEVLYEPEKQIIEAMAYLLSLFDKYSLIDSDQDLDAFRLSCAEFGIILAAFKHPAFKTEREVRCVHAVGLEKTSKGAYCFTDEGIVRDGVEFKAQPIGFYVRDGHLTAHLDLPMDISGECPIEAVVTGPKNHTATGNLLLYLASEGLDALKFGHSLIPYR